jgi:Cu/Ag efflux protein CusF
MKKFVFVILFMLTSLSWAGPEWTKADVIKVEPERHRIVLKHERIQSIDMDAMTMLFDVAPSLALKKYKANDKVRFQVRIIDGVLVVTALEKMP